jgi:hypothetical protein
VVEQIKQVESGGDAGAKSKTSSATGLFGFTDGTWIEQARQAIPEAQGMTAEEVLALRDDEDMQQVVMEHFTAGNAAALEEGGHEVNPANVYTLHFAGRTGGQAVLNADEGAALSSVLSADAMKANKNVKNSEGKKFADWTVAEFRAWAREKMGE